MIYDFAVVGAGAVGAAIARELSMFHLSVAVLEKECDAGFGVSKANSGIVHAGFHHLPGTLKAKLEVRGNRLFGKLAGTLGFPFRRCGVVMAAFSPGEMEICRELYERGRANGVEELELCGRARILEVEPKLNREAIGGLFAAGGGVVEPYAYVFAMLDSARFNGVEFLPDFSLASASFNNGIWSIAAKNKRSVQARNIVNAAGLFADEVSRRCGGEEFTILPRKGEEYLLDKNSPARPERVVFPVPSGNSKGMLVIPTAGGTTMVGPTAEMVPDKEELSTSVSDREMIFAQAARLVPGVSLRDMIASFAGMRPVLKGNEDFYIAYSRKAPNLIQVAGIQSPGLTASPAIGEYVAGLIAESGTALRRKEEPRREPPPLRSARDMGWEELERLHAGNPGWTDIVCHCERVSEAEIVEAIRRGHTTLDGIKFQTRAGMGRCQGGFCGVRIMEIVARETGVPLDEISKRGGSTRISAGLLGQRKVEELRK